VFLKCATQGGPKLDVLLIAFLQLWLKFWDGIDKYWVVTVRKLFYFHHWGYLCSRAKYCLLHLKCLNYENIWTMAQRPQPGTEIPAASAKDWNSSSLSQGLRLQQPQPNKSEVSEAWRTSQTHPSSNSNWIEVEVKVEFIWRKIRISKTRKKP